MIFMRKNITAADKVNKMYIKNHILILIVMSIRFDYRLLDSLIGLYFNKSYISTIF